jgi:elongation factor Tu
LLDLVEMEIRDLLTKYNFPATRRPIIRGSATAAGGQARRRKGHQRPAGRGGQLHPAARRAKIDKPFLMCIEDVFNIEGRGTVVTGRVERGVLKKMDRSRNRRPEGHRKTVATGHRNVPQAARQGQRRRQRRRAAARHQEGEVERGMVLAKPGTITPHTKFKAEVYVLSKDEGGRHTPFFTNYRPQFYFRTTT